MEVWTSFIFKQPLGLSGQKTRICTMLTNKSSIYIQRVQRQIGSQYSVLQKQTPHGYVQHVQAIPSFSVLLSSKERNAPPSAHMPHI